MSVCVHYVSLRVFTAFPCECVHCLSLCVCSLSFLACVHCLSLRVFTALQCLKGEHGRIRSKRPIYVMPESPARWRWCTDCANVRPQGNAGKCYLVSKAAPPFPSLNTTALHCLALPCNRLSEGLPPGRHNGRHHGRHHLPGAPGPAGVRHSDRRCLCLAVSAAVLAKTYRLCLRCRSVRSKRHCLCLALSAAVLPATDRLCLLCRRRSRQPRPAQPAR